MSTIMFREAISAAIREEMLRDEKVFVMGEDVGVTGGSFKATRGLYQEFGKERVRNTPLSEHAIVGAAVGAAMAGAKPVAEIMHIDFTGCCMDAIANQMAKMYYKTGGAVTVPMVLRTQGGRGRSNSCTQSQSLEAWMAHIPGLMVVMPSTPYDAKGLLKTAIRSDNPVVFIEHKKLYQMKGEVPEQEYFIPLGKADVKRQGTDVTIISYSHSIHTSLEAAYELEKQGISAEVVDIRTLVPFDMDTIEKSVRKTGRVVIVHEAVQRGGYGAEISAQIADRVFDYLDAPIIRVAGLNIPVPNATLPEIESAPTAAKVISAVKGLL
jgi:pyruvate/2-oxoglutarate/acetoin dehydrogenase E1 component